MIARGFSPDELMAAINGEAIDNRVVPDNPAWRYFPWVPRSPAGVRVTHDTAFQVSAIWACIDVVSKSLASQPWNVFRKVGRDDRDLLPNDTVAYLLNMRPNPEMTAIAMREALMIAALSWGNGYAEILRDGNNLPYALWPIAPDRVMLTRNEDWELVYRVSNETGDWTDLSPMDVLHIKGPGITGLIGDDVIVKAVHSIGLAMAAERFGETYFGNSTQMGGILKLAPGAKLNDDALNQLKRALNENSQGPNRANKTIVLENAQDYQQLGSTAKDSQLVEIREFQIAEICRWFGVPPHKIADLSRSTNNNIEHQGLEFVRDALTPWARRNEQEADYKLFPPRGTQRFTKIDLEPLSQGDAVSRGTYYTAMRAMGAYSVNDILKLEGKNTIGKEGDIRVVNSAFIELENVGTNLRVLSGPDAVPDTPDDQLNDGEDATGDTVVNVLRTLFSGEFERIEKRSKQRAADLARNSRDAHAAFDAFVRQQQPSIAQNLIKPCEILSRITGCETYLMATRIAGEVLNCETSANAATEKLLHMFPPRIAA